jgi:phosphoribosylaminoimidazole-succinocarboxamide synthase
MLVRKTRPLPIECVVRGYITGSGLIDYQTTGAICGIALPKGLRDSDRLPAPLFTPSTKAEIGTHDENISYEVVEQMIGSDVAAKVRNLSIAIYSRGAELALDKGIIIADTKFEFGLDDHAQLVWIDEALTPDSSRFWPVDAYRPGGSQPSFDKQFVRDYLRSLQWNKKPPAPKLPPDVIATTSSKYVDALKRLTGNSLM